MTDTTEQTTAGGESGGEYSTRGSYVSGGQEYTRDTNYIETRITRDGRDGYPVEPGRRSEERRVGKECPV